jgi:hypothetical protein
MAGWGRILCYFKFSVGVGTLFLKNYFLIYIGVLRTKMLVYILVWNSQMMGRSILRSSHPFMIGNLS